MCTYNINNEKIKITGSIDHSKLIKVHIEYTFSCVNGVAGLTGFSFNKMCGQKVWPEYLLDDHINEVTVRQGSTLPIYRKL